MSLMQIVLFRCSKVIVDSNDENRQLLQRPKIRQFLAFGIDSGASFSLFLFCRLSPIYPFQSKM